MLTLSLPVAPSANNAYINRTSGKGYGRIKSASHRSWIKDADAYYVLQQLQRATPIKGPYDCKLVYPKKVRTDIDNRSKLILDWMVSRGLTSNDRYCRRLLSEPGDEPGNLVWIYVKEFVEP